MSRQSRRVVVGSGGAVLGGVLAAACGAGQGSGTQVAAPAKWPVRLAWTDAVADAFDAALAEVVEALAAVDGSARRIHDSYQAFRHLLGDDVIA